MFAEDHPLNSFPFVVLKELIKKLEEKRVALNKATSMGEAILSICHPDSITTIKHWNTIIKARFEEVSPQLHVHIDAFLSCHSQVQVFKHFVHLNSLDRL